MGCCFTVPAYVCPPRIYQLCIWPQLNTCKGIKGCVFSNLKPCWPTSRTTWLLFCRQHARQGKHVSREPVSKAEGHEVTTRAPTVCRLCLLAVACECAVLSAALLTFMSSGCLVRQWKQVSAPWLKEGGRLETAASPAFIRLLAPAPIAVASAAVLECVGSQALQGSCALRSLGGQGPSTGGPGLTRVCRLCVSRCARPYG